MATHVTGRCGPFDFYFPEIDCVKAASNTKERMIMLALLQKTRG